MKWYREKQKELASAAPMYSACGDDCAVCPRFVARTEEELRETAVFWKNAGWRDHVVSTEEIKCTGCKGKTECSLNLLPCLRAHRVEKCGDCKEFLCSRIKEMIENSDAKKEACRRACETEAEYKMLVRAFYEKEENLKK